MLPIRTWLTNAYQMKISCTVERGLARESGGLHSSLGLDISLMQVGLWRYYHPGLSFIIDKTQVRLNRI